MPATQGHDARTMARASVTPRNLSFDSVPVGQTTYETILVDNTGPFDLKTSLGSRNGIQRCADEAPKVTPFCVHESEGRLKSDWTFVVPAHRVARLDVAFSPSEVGATEHAQFTVQATEVPFMGIEVLVQGTGE